MARRYYHLSSLRMVEAVARRLENEAEMSTTRLLGYAHRHILRIDHPLGEPLDDVIRELDPLGRPLPGPPVGASELGTPDDAVVPQADDPG